MLFSGLLDGEGGHAGHPAGLLQVEPGGAEPAGVVDLQQAHAHRREQDDRVLAGRQQVVQVFQCRRAWPVVAASRAFQMVSTRPAPTILVMSAAFDPLRIARINGQLFDLGGQEADFRTDQLDQEVAASASS